jgi:hypothetical protein|tara:strand:+ start:1439 stop:1942 length:504 start_codon:yes stop_codon:yes gene_type:complete
MQKKVLSDVDLIYGDVSMPEGFEIDQNRLAAHSFVSKHQNIPFPFSRTWDMLNKYIIEHIFVRHKIALINKKNWSNLYTPLQHSFPLLEIDKVDLKNSPDYVMLYAVDVKDCSIKIYYDDNRRKGRSWDIELKNNMFIMFPSTNMYYITNNHKNFVNIIHTITYDKI